MTKIDIIGRRDRITPVSTGKRIILQKRDVVWLKALAEHGALPASYLLQYYPAKSEKRAKERLTDLFHEDNTDDGGAYLSRPPQQWRTIDSRYNELVYDLAAVGKAVLAKQGLEPKTGKSPWLHGFMTACITASIELACMARADIAFIRGSQILKRANSSLRYRLNNSTLVPDALFGLEYRQDGKKSYRFYMVEADRGTEPLSSKQSYRKSFKRHLEQYQNYIENTLYKDHLNLTAPLLVLNISASDKRMERLIAHTESYFPQGCKYQLFQSWERFGNNWKPPKPKAALLEGVWRRGGVEGFRIG